MPYRVPDRVVDFPSPPLPRLPPAKPSFPWRSIALGMIAWSLGELVLYAVVRPDVVLVYGLLTVAFLVHAGRSVERYGRRFGEYYEARRETPPLAPPPPPPATPGYGYGPRTWDRC